MAVDIQLYATSYTQPSEIEKVIEWSKIAVIEEGQQKISDRTVGVVKLAQ